VSLADEPGVELANRNGRLHPTQRGKVLDGNFWVPALLVVAGIASLVYLPIKAVADAKEASSIHNEFPSASVGGTTGTVLPTLGLMVPIAALVAWFAFVCWRRLSEVRDGRLVEITGWTHDFGRNRPTGQYPIELHTAFHRGRQYYLTANRRTYVLTDRKLRERIQAERNNTVFLTPRTRLLINVLPG